MKPTLKLISNASPGVPAGYADDFAPLLAARAALDDAEPEHAPRLLGLAEAAAIVPLSEKQLRRVATRPDGSGPFRKIEGRWLVYEDDLHAWVRAHPTGRPVDHSTSPRPRRPRPTAGLRAVLAEDEVPS